MVGVIRNRDRLTQRTSCLFCPFYDTNGRLRTTDQIMVVCDFRVIYKRLPSLTLFLLSPGHLFTLPYVSDETHKILQRPFEVHFEENLDTELPTYFPSELLFHPPPRIRLPAGVSTPPSLNRTRPLTRRSSVRGDLDLPP